MSRHYVYVYCNVDAMPFVTSSGILPGVPFYVGMGTGQRWMAHLAEAKAHPKKCNRRKVNTINKILRTGAVPQIVKLAKGLSKEDAVALEMKLIAEIGTLVIVEGVVKRGPLTNLHRGGAGGFEHANDLKHRAKRGAAISASNTQAVIEKRIETRKTNGWFTNEALQRREELVASGALKHTAESCERISTATTVAMNRSDVKAKMVAGAERRWSNPDEKKKIAERNSKTFELIHRETGERLIIKNMAAFCRDTGSHPRKVHKEYLVVDLAIRTTS